MVYPHAFFINQTTILQKLKYLKPQKPSSNAHSKTIHLDHALL
jgi:hypothetical protein